MFEQHTTPVFLIERLGITLLVIYQSSGLVKIEPFFCKLENRRLWSGISTTQAALAQAQLGQRKQKDPVVVLREVFHQAGWNITMVDENMLPEILDNPRQAVAP